MSGCFLFCVCFRTGSPDVAQASQGAHAPPDVSFLSVRITSVSTMTCCWYVSFIKLYFMLFMKVISIYLTGFYNVIYPLKELAMFLLLKKKDKIVN